MRPTRIALAAAVLALLLVSAPVASAESVSVGGRGDIDRMAVDNGKRGLTVKVYGLKPPCHDFAVVVSWGTRDAYHVGAFCAASRDPLIADLYFNPNRRIEGGRGGLLVRCPGFRLNYDRRGRFYRAFVPRSCMRRAPDRVRVRSESRDRSAGINGRAGLTRALRRG